MSGKKRALVGMDAQMASRLTTLEAHLGDVQADYRLVQARIAAMRAEEENRSTAMHAARQQALQEAMVGIENRFQTLEAHTAAALCSQEMQAARHIQNLEAGMNQINNVLSSLAYKLEQQHLAAKDTWRSAQETLETAKTLEQALSAYYPARLWKTERPRILAWLEESEANLYRGLDEAALLAAQQAYLDLQGVRMSMEANFQRQHRLRLTAIQRLSEVLVLAESNAGVQAVDLQGQFLNTWIDVNRWSGGRLGRAHARAEALLHQVTGHSSELEATDWRELLEEQIPALEQDVCDAVRLARQAVLVSQIRFNIAERVTAALAEQGYALVQSGWQKDGSQSYQVSLCDYNGSQVVVSVFGMPAGKTNQAPEQPCRLDIRYHNQEALSEHILSRSVEEIYAALRAAGLDVSALSGNEPSDAVLVQQAARPAGYQLPQQPAALPLQST